MKPGKLRLPCAWLAGACGLLCATAATAQDNMPESAGSSALVSAVSWIQATLLGTLATTIAIIAIAAVGFLLMTGRIDWRRGVTTIIGCFVLFGAPTIAAGILSALNGIGGSEPTSDVVTPPPPAPVPAPPPIAVPKPPPVHEPVL